MSGRIRLKDAFKAGTPGFDKVRSPGETLEDFREKTGRLKTALLKKTERIDSGRLDIPVYISECGHEAKALTGTSRQMGKGVTPAQAEASAVMELAERYSFFKFYTTPRNFITDTYKNVRADALPFSMILQSVDDSGGDETAKRKIFEDLPLQWTWGYNLTRQEAVLVPFDWFYMINEFNGPSAGNCTEEAISQGICEVVERHSSSLISRGRLNVPGIDPDSSADPAVSDMIEKYRQAGISLSISDFTLDTGIPTVGVMAYDPATFPADSEIVWTAGTSPDPHKALSRALTETAQLGGDFNSGACYEASGLPKIKSLEEGRFIMNPETVAPIDSLPDISDPNIKTEVENEIAALSKIGMEVIVIDTTDKGLSIPAFYTIIPGAHFRERAAESSVGMFSARLVTESFHPAEAMAKLDEIDRLIPEQYYTSFYKGLVSNMTGDPESALRFFKNALELAPPKPNIPDICSHMGVALKDLEQYERALEVLAVGESVDSERTDIHNLKGFCHFKLKNHEKAVACFKKVIAINPGSAIDYANIASNYRDMGNTEEALTYYAMALEIDPGLDFARENLEKLSQKP